MFHRVLLRSAIAVGAAAFLLAPAATAVAGDASAGDAWLDNVGQSAGSGHEMDPHLACQDINLWGAGLANSAGEYTIDGRPPSGSREQFYASSWHYNIGARGRQVLDVISVTTLIANAVAHGDVAHSNQGFHFKLEFLQDPQKHKTFWVDCPMPSNTPGGPPTSGGSGSGVIATATVKQSISAVTIVRCRRGMVKRTKLVHGYRVVACVARKRHHRRRRHAIVHKRRGPVYTG